MSAPTANEIKLFLEGYGVTETVLTNDWLELRRDRFVIPYVQKYTGINFTGVQRASS